MNYCETISTLFCVKNVLHVAGSGSAFNTLANAILILKVNGIHAVCKPPEPDVYDVPHCIYPIANQKHLLHYW